MKRSCLAIAITAIGITAASAQSNPECSGQLVSRARNVCDAAIDGARLFHPVVGLLVSGGSPALGEVGAHGGFPHVSIGLRANATTVVTPDLDYNGNGRVVGADEEITAPSPSIEAALGVFRGTRDGNLAVDVLGAAQLLPTNQIDDVRVDDDATSIGDVALSFGYGARVTVLGGRGSLPVVAVSVMRRSLPRIDVGDVPGGDRFGFGTDLTTTNLRAMVGKEIGPLLVSVGYGRDSYRSDAEIAYRDPVSDVVQPSIRLDLEDARSLGFVDVALGLGAFRIAGEVGMQRGKDLGLGTTFTDNDPTERRIFGGAAIRFVF